MNHTALAEVAAAAGVSAPAPTPDVVAAAINALEAEPDQVRRATRLNTEIIPMIAALSEIEAAAFIDKVSALHTWLKRPMLQREVDKLHREASATTKTAARETKAQAASSGSGAGGTGGKDGRVSLLVNGDLAAMVKDVWYITNDLNGGAPRLFRYPDGSALAGLRNGDEGPVRRMHGIDSLRLFLAQQIRVRKFDTRTGNDSDCHPPDNVVKSMLTAPPDDLPALDRVVTAPIVGREGELLTTPGYHSGSGTFYWPRPGFTMPEVPDAPTGDQVAAARDMLVTPLADFPFTSSSELAHTIAAVLLPFLREMIDGPTPLHLITKPSPGTGASLLCDVIGIITSGGNAPAGVEPKDEDELRKRLTSSFMAAAPIILLDNVRHLRGGALAAALTTVNWTDRILGQSNNTTVKVRCLWLGTSNNPKVSNELSRRTVRIGLDAHVERAWEREGFRIPNLREWTKEHRGELVAAALTLIRAWVVAGKPAGTHTLGSYETWARVVGGVLNVAGIPGFLENLDEFYAEADEEGRNDRAFVEAWFEKYGDQAVQVSDLFGVAKAILDLGPGEERSQRTRLGRTHLARLRGRIVSGRLVAEAGKYQHAQLWKLAPAPAVGQGLVIQFGERPVNVVNVEKQTFTADVPEMLGSVTVVNVAGGGYACTAARVMPVRDPINTCAPVCATRPAVRAEGGVNVHDVHRPDVTPTNSQAEHPVNVETPTFTTFTDVHRGAETGGSAGVGSAGVQEGLCTRCWRLARTDQGAAVVGDGKMVCGDCLTDDDVSNPEVPG